MLVFSRKIGESFIVGEDIRITVVRVDGSADPVVKIGIEAPDSVRVDRAEIRQRIQAAEAARRN